MSQTEQIIPRNVKKLIKKFEELWKRTEEEIVIEKCNDADLIDTLLIILGEFRDEVSYKIYREKDAIAIWLYDILGNDRTLILFPIEGEYKCLVLIPD